jgi:hypothetical protein
MEENQDFSGDIQQEANIHGSSLNESQVGQADTLNQFKSSASFQGDNGRYTNNILNALIVPSINGLQSFFRESFGFFENISNREDEEDVLIDLKKRELQLKVDTEYWPFCVGRGDTYQFLSRNRDKLIVIPSPPEILVEEPAFKSVHTESFRGLKNVLKKYYSPKASERFSGNTDSPFVICENIFKSHVKDIHVDLFGRFLEGIPVVIINSEITHLNIFVNFTIPCFDSGSDDSNSTNLDYSTSGQPIHFSLPPLDWQFLKSELRQYVSEEDCFREIICIVVHMQKSVALLASDLYCMSINWQHNPCLFDYVKDDDFPEYLSKWIEPFLSGLLNLKEHLQGLLDEQERRQEEMHQAQQYKDESSGQFSVDFSPGIDSDYEGWWIGGIVIAVFFVMVSGSSVISEKSSNSPKEMTSIELLNWEELGKAADVWDDTTAKRNLTVLKRSKDPCVSEFAVMLERSLQSLGAEGFKNIQPIKTQLNSQLSCNL